MASSGRVDRALVVLRELRSRGPVPVGGLHSVSSCCESERHGLSAELRAAGLIEHREIGGQASYVLTEQGRRRLAEGSEGEPDTTSER